MKKVLDKDLKIQLLISIAFLFMLSVFAPIEMYLTNRDEFWFDILTIMAPLLLQFLITVLLLNVLLLLLHMINERLYRLIIILLFCTMLILYIHGTFITGGLNKINGQGESIDEIYVLFSYFITGIIIAAVFFAFFKLHLKKTRIVIGKCSAVLICILLITSLGECFFYGGFSRKQKEYYSSYNDIMTYSSEQNVIIILLDYVDYKAFKQAIDTYEGYSGSNFLHDFDAYNNVMGAYPFTYFTIPLILTGELYTYQENFIDYLNKGFESSEFLNELKNDKYKIDIYEEKMGLFYYDLDDSIVKSFSNFAECKVKIKSYVDFLYQIDSLVLYRYLPYYIKNVDDVARINMSSTVGDSYDKEMFAWDNDRFYEKIKGDISVNKKKYFKFIHIEGGHPGFHLDRDLKETEKIISTTDDMKAFEAAYNEQLLGCCKLLDEYMEMLEKADVYDNSIIIVMSDHGYNAEFERSKNPILFVKGRNEHKEQMDEYNLPLSYVDIGEIMMNVLHGKTGNEIFDYRYLMQNRRYYSTGHFEFKNVGDYFEEHEQEADISKPLVDTGVTYVNQWNW